MRRSSLGRLRSFLAHLGSTLGWHGLTSGVIALVAFAFGIVMLAQEVMRPREAEHKVLHRVLVNWTRAPDYLGKNLLDYARDWRIATEPARGILRKRVDSSIRALGLGLQQADEQFPLITVVEIDLIRDRGESVAHWTQLFTAGPSASVVAEEIPIVESDERGPRLDLRVRYQVAPEVDSVVAETERTYNQLIRALIGLSGTSLLCFGYMVLHVLGLRDRVAREAAREATLDLADRTCHELGNVAFVVANERRNLAGHIALLDRFVAEEGEALGAAARRVGLAPDLARRLEAAVRREYAGRAIDPAIEIRRSVAMARDVCRQIATCSDYIALTVRELDGHLKGAELPVTPGPLSASEVLDDALALLAPRIEAADAAVERLDDPAAPALVIGDRRLLAHALVNLIKNAVEAASGPDGRPVVTLSVRTEPGITWIEVADNGPGIPDAVLPRIFEDGYSSKGAGRGQGLAIVQESVALQGGRIEASNRADGGAVFAVGLPPAAPRSPSP